MNVIHIEDKNWVPIAKQIVGIVIAEVDLHRRQLSLPKFRKWTQCKWKTQFSYLDLEALPFRQGSYMFKTINYVYGTEIVHQVSLQRRWLFWPSYRKWSRRESYTQHFDLELQALPLSERSYFFNGYNTYIITKLSYDTQIMTPKLSYVYDTQIMSRILLVQNNVLHIS